MKKIFLPAMMALVLLSGCAGAENPAVPVETTAAAQAATVPETAPETLPEETAIEIAQEAAALAAPPDPAIPVVLACDAPGILEERNERAVIDYSNHADGYVMACFTDETNSRLKLRVTGPKTTYTYNLVPGEWSTFPLSDGNGSYKVTIYLGTGGSQYATLMSTSFETTLEDEFAPFLRPNQYVNYENAPETIARGHDVCAGISQPLEKVAAVYDYVVDNFSYDYHKAATVKSGYLPVLDTVLAEQKGICFDYAAVMAAMLRSQQIPCKLVVGYAGSQYHAWISVWTEENGWVDGAIFFDGQTWKRMDPTFASTAERSDSIMQFIESGSYTEKYLY